MPQQVVFLLPILEGLDGAKKMSKTLGNFVGVTETAEQMFGKLMSISDELMAKYYTVLLRRDLPADAHPLQAKKDLAMEIVATYHSPEIAKRTLDDWNTRFSEKRLSESDLPTFKSAGGEIVAIAQNAYREVFQLERSRGEIGRLVKQGSVQIDGTKHLDPKETIELKAGQVLRLDKTHAVRVG
jgi:tyrosyl-tRNA synthetase